MLELLQLANSTSDFGVNPDDNEEYIIEDAVAVEAHPLPENPNYVHFISIRSLAPSKGYGSRAMGKVMELADNNSIILVGRIIPYHTQNLSKRKLRDWYRKMGCRPSNPRDEDGLWVRAPGGGHININIGKVSKFKVLNGLSEQEFSERKYFFVTLFAVGLLFFLKKCK